MFKDDLLGFVEGNDGISASKQQKLNLAGEINTVLIRQVSGHADPAEHQRTLAKVIVVIKLHHMLEHFSV